jgi:hypothetical protein
MTASQRVNQVRRGAVLLEILIALALITGGGMMILGVLGNAYGSLARARRIEFANDLARSKIAELEAGLISAMELQGGVVERVGSVDLLGGIGRADLIDETWILDVQTIQSAFQGLTEVVVHVYLDAPDVVPERPLATARQLVELREGPADEYEEDPLLRGLPAGDER